MTIKPFAIQGSTLTIGGVDLQAGTTGVVIPGVTQAVNYLVKEVDEMPNIGGQDLGDDAGAITVIDNAEYLYLVDDGDSPSADYVAATYSVDELDELGNIKEIDVETEGVFLAADKTRAEAANMWATLDATPFVSFNSANWIQIPFRPKMRAGEIENIGGGGINFDEDGALNLVNNGVIRNQTDSEDVNIVATGFAQLQWTTPEGVAESDPNGTNEPKNWVYVEQPGVFVETNINGTGGPEDTYQWKFGTDGSLEFPDGSIQTTAYTGNTSDANVWVQTFETDTPTDIVQLATSVEYDGNGNIIALFAHYNDGVELNGSTYYSVGKYTATGAKIWTARLLNSFYTDGWGLAVDTENNWIYVAGVSNDDNVGEYNLSLLTKFDGDNGSVEWSKSYDFGFGCQSPVVDVDSDSNPIVVGYAYNGDDNYVTTTKINADTGEVIWSRALEGQGAEEAYGMAVGPDSEVVTVGYMDQLDETVSHSVTPLTGSATNILVINRSDLSGDILTDTWEVAGTGITGTIGVNAINVYTGLTGTVREGSGATFDFVIAGDGSLNNPVTVNQGGINYLVGHKIKIPYTEPFGGADANSDIIITVTAVSTGGVITSVAAGYFGAGSGTPNSYYGFVGTNYQTGSGLTFNFFGDSGSTYTEHPTEITAVGTNYVLDDVITISGALLGGTSPTNDLIGTVNANLGGVVQFMSFSGTQQTATYRVRTEDGGPDFSGTGTWTLSGTVTNVDDRMLVVKYNTLGAIQWQKAILFDEGFSSTGADADIDSDGNIYVCGQYESDTLEGPLGQAMSIVKFNSSGVKQWMRRVDGNCGGWTSSIVVGPDDKLYLSATTFTGTDSNDLDVSTVLAKYNLDGTVAWQRLLDYTEGLSAGGFFFFGPGGGSIGSGSNLAVKQGYVAVGLGFSADFQGNPEDYRAAVAQVSAAGDVFTVGSWDFKAANFSGTLDDDASEITVVNAGKTDLELSSGVDGDITTTTVTPMSDVADFLLGTLYTSGGADERLVNGANQLVLEANGAVTLPAGGTISEGVVTSNPTIQLTPATPDVASQKLVIKGGGSFSNTENGIYLSTYNLTWAVSTTVEFNVYDLTRANETLYWWIVPEGSGISETMSGTVTLDGIGDGTFTFTLDSDAYEFRVRVSPEDNNYDPDNTGVESVLLNADEPTFDGEHHLHLTTGNLTETSIFLGTDDHNVRTTTDGKIQITTPNDLNNVWEFGGDGATTFPTLTVPISDNTTPNGTGQTLKFGDSSQQAIIFGPVSTVSSPNAERVIIQGAPGYTGTDGEGGDVYVWAGPGGDVNGQGGDIKVRAGQGDGTGSGGYLNFQAGDSGTGYGGYINIESGETGTYGQGGDITVQAMDGGRIVLRTFNSENNSRDWIFENNGSTTLPGAVVNSTTSRPTTTGIPNSFTLSTGNNTNLTPGNYSNILVGFTGKNITLGVQVSSGFNITIYGMTNASPATFVIGDSAVIPGNLIGGATPADDLTITVDSLDLVAIDLTKTINKLTDGDYVLGDGVEGQIMYIVRSPETISENVFVEVENGDGDNPLRPFMTNGGFANIDNTGICTLIFTDGSWKQTGGLWD